MEAKLVDVVYKVGSKKKWKNKEELKYSIRSVEKNFVNLRNIVIVGTLPDWAKNIKHIEAHDPYIDKDSNIIHKLLMACRDEEVSANFVNMSDDQYFIKSTTYKQLYPYNLNTDLRRMQKMKEVSAYGKKIKRTVNLLQSQNLPAHNYEGHIPYLINKERYLNILSNYKYDQIGGLCGNTVYFNNLNDFEEVPVERVRAYFRKAAVPSRIKNRVEGKLFLSIQKAALNKDMKDYIQSNFSEKSKYE